LWGCFLESERREGKVVFLGFLRRMRPVFAAVKVCDMGEPFLMMRVLRTLADRWGGLGGGLGVLTRVCELFRTPV